MRIAFDATSLGREQCGIGCYTIELLSEMYKLSPNDEFLLTDALLGRFATSERVRFPLEHLTLLKFLKTPFPLMTLFRALLYTGRLATGMTGLAHCDIFFGTNFRGVFAEGMRTVLTIHDMVHEYLPETVQQVNMDYYRSGFPEAVARADLLIAVSDATRNDIIKFLNVSDEKIKVIYNGVDDRFRPVTDPESLARVRQRYRLPERFVLMVGSIQPRKNIDGVLAALKLLAERDVHFPWKLVLAGSEGWKNEGLAEQIRRLGLTDRVHFAGFVTGDDLPVLYSLADLFVYPSLYEGFGLPVVEAMACGVPVVTSNTSCLPEIAGDAALLVDPHDEKDIAEGMLRLLEDRELRTRCIERGETRARMFSWREAASQTLQAFRELTGKGA